jgi:hypothetical protein
MNKRRAVIQVSLVAVAAALYYLALVWAMTLLAIIPVNNHELDGASRLLLMSLKHGGAVAAASVPFVLSIRALRLERPVVVALSIALLGGVLPVLTNVLLYQSSFVGSWMNAADIFKLAATLPLLTWLSYRLVPSNNSFKPTPLRGAA